MRFLSIWFHHLATDWFALKQPALRTTPFVLAAPSHGRMVITAANALAESESIYAGMVVADARAMFPSLLVLDDRPALTGQLLQRIAEWCIRFTPIAAVDAPAGLLLDVTGCTHLWGGDEAYLQDIIGRLKNRGYGAKAAMADTVGAAWGVARFGKDSPIIQPGAQAEAVSFLPAAALRLDNDIAERLNKLGLRQVKDFISMPRTALRRRFGVGLIQRLDQALGHEEERLEPVQPPQPYAERLPAPEPIVTLTGIEIALQHLLRVLCLRLQSEGKGLREAYFRGYRADSKAVGIQVGTSRPSHGVEHLFHLFSLKLSTIEPAGGIELFVLEATKVEDHLPLQEELWKTEGGLHDLQLSQLIDRLENKVGAGSIKRYFPDEHYLPERAIKLAASLQEKPTIDWEAKRPRPLQLLSVPERIEVTAPIPDYPPMLFRYKEKVHKIIRADGPERIEQEWWIQEGEHRDYYAVEDEEGQRYWLFRSGHYTAQKSYQWFLHGFFA